MKSTSLTVGGFTQPGVARSLIEMPANSDKGLSHRFLWIFPNPLFEKFSELGEVDHTFIEKISKKLAIIGQCIMWLLSFYSKPPSKTMGKT